MEMGHVGFDEFAAWFRRTCASIERYRRGLAQANAAGGKAGVVEQLRHQSQLHHLVESRLVMLVGDEVDKMLVRAQKKFDKLDARWQWVHWKVRSLWSLQSGCGRASIQEEMH